MTDLRDAIARHLYEDVPNPKLLHGWDNINEPAKDSWRRKADAILHLLDARDDVAIVGVTKPIDAWFDGGTTQLVYVLDADATTP